MTTYRTYRFHWRDGKIEDGRGESVESAFRALGYGGGAISALDRYEVIDVDSGINLPWRIHTSDVGSVVMDAKDNVVRLDVHMPEIVAAMNRNGELVAALRAYEAWEADLFSNGDWSRATVRLKQDHHDRLVEIKAMRNSALFTHTNSSS